MIKIEQKLKEVIVNNTKQCKTNLKVCKAIIYLKEQMKTETGQKKLIVATKH